MRESKTTEQPFAIALRLALATLALVLAAAVLITFALLQPRVDAPVASASAIRAGMM